MKNAFVSVVIPTYNESQNIPILVKELSEILKEDYEIIIADDDSPDKTWKVAQELSKDYPVIFIRRMHDKGLSQSVVDGLKAAKGEICVVMDADLSHPPMMVKKLIHAVKEKNFDVAVGSRLIGSGKVENWPWYRRMISGAATSLAWPISPVKDTMSGFFAIKKEKISFPDIVPIGYKIMLEILVKSRPLIAIEIPYTFRNRELGESKLTMKIQLQYIKHLFNLYRHYLFGKKHQKPSLPPGYYDIAVRNKKGIQVFWHMKKFDTLKDLLGDYKGKRILELGCGPGTFLSMLKPEYSYALGLDIDENQILYANRKYRRKNLDFKLIDITKDLPEGKFDKVIISEVLEHLPFHASQVMLCKVKEILNEGGEVLITTPNYRSLWPIIELGWNMINPVNYAELHINKYSSKKLHKQLSKNGLKVVRSGSFFVLSPFLPLPSGAKNSIYKVEKEWLPKMGSLLYCKATSHKHNTR